MPFGPYSDFNDCLGQMADRYPDEEQRKRVCGALQSRLGEKSDQGHTYEELPDEAKGMWMNVFTEQLDKNEDEGASKIAWASVYRRYEKTPNGSWVPFKVFDNIQFKSLLKADRVIYGAASVAIVDDDNELITESALKTAFSSYVDRGHVLFYHRNIPIGEVLPEYVTPAGEKIESGVREGKLNVVVRIYKDTKKADEVWDAIERGELRAFSIGGEVIGQAVKVCDEADKCFNRIDRIDLHEISIVPNPANDASYFQVVKSKVEPIVKKEPHPAEIKLNLLEKLINEEWSKTRNCPKFTLKANKIIQGETMSELEELQKTVEDLKAEVEALKPKPEETKAEHEGGCPEGQHMVDGECVPIAEKAAEPDPVKVGVDALTAEVKQIAEAVSTLKASVAPLLAKASEPEAPKETKETPKVPEVAPKKSVDTSGTKGEEPLDSIDWATIGINKPGEQYERAEFKTAFAKLKGAK